MRDTGAVMGAGNGVGKGVGFASELREEALLRDGRRVFEERGFFGVTMEDVAEAAGCARSTVYRYARDCTELLVAVAERYLTTGVPVARPPGNPAAGVAAWIVDRQERDARLDQVVRGVAAGGVPRARAFVAQLDLVRHEEAVAVLARIARGPADERVHLVELLLEPARFRHLVERCGWSRDEYVRWLTGELWSIQRRTAPDC